MRDAFGREIDYLRLSITDRCNLRCAYCMPGGADFLPADELLTAEELLRACRAAAALGIRRFKVTGGEPLARPDALCIMRAIRALPGVDSVTLTTNGLLLEPLLGELRGLVDGVNVSVDTPDPAAYAALTGCDGAARALRAARLCAEAGIRTKLNCVLLAGVPGAAELARLAEALPLDVRYIQLMPIGAGGAARAADPNALMAELRERYPDMHPVDEARGNGPARYFASEGLIGRIGLIDALDHSFCHQCNRIRLTAEGRLKPCLCYDDSIDLRSLLRGGAGDAELREAMASAIRMKPRAHVFGAPGGVTERQRMSRIGG